MSVLVPPRPPVWPASRGGAAVTTLEVRDLAVEAGGRTVVRGPVVHGACRRQDRRGRSQRRRQDEHAQGPGGRGAAAARAGVTRRGAVGYLRQDPRQHRADDDVTGLEHILAARGLVDLARRTEKARIALEEAHSDRNIGAVRPARGGVPGPGRLRRPSPRPGRSPRGWVWRRTGSRCPCGALSGGERRRLELARILFGGSDLLLLDEPTNHLDADAKHWLMRFLASYRGALLVVSHDIALLDASITRILHLDRDGVVEYRGTYTQYRTAARPPTRSGSPRSPAGRSRRSAG